MGARGKSQFLYRCFQQLFSFRGNFAMLAEQFRRHLRIGINFLLVLEARRAGRFAQRSRVRARPLMLRRRCRRGAPCTSPPALRCECRCGRAAARKFSRRSAESASACNGSRAWRSPKNPQGQGFIAAASMKRAGKVSEMRRARDGDHSVFERLAQHFQHVALEIPGSSSRNSTPLCPSETSPGRGMAPPPIKPASLMVWCGER